MGAANAGACKSPKAQAKKNVSRNSSFVGRQTIVPFGTVVFSGKDHRVVTAAPAPARFRRRGDFPPGGGNVSGERHARSRAPRRGGRQPAGGRGTGKAARKVGRRRLSPVGVPLLSASVPARAGPREAGRRARAAHRGGRAGRGEPHRLWPGRRETPPGRAAGEPRRRRRCLPTQSWPCWTRKRVCGCARAWDSTSPVCA